MICQRHLTTGPDGTVYIHWHARCEWEVERLQCNQCIRLPMSYSHDLRLLLTDWYCSCMYTVSVIYASRGLRAILVSHPLSAAEDVSMSSVKAMN